MSVRVRDKNGKPHTVNALRAISNPKSFREKIEQIKKRGARSNSSTVDNWEEKVATASKETQNAEESTDELTKKREELLAQIQKLTTGIATINEHTKNEAKAKPKLATSYKRSDTSIAIDTDPRWPDSKATKADFKDMGVPEAERAELSLDQCAFLLFLNEHYDRIKYETIAARFFDKTFIRVTASEIKLMVEQDSKKSD